MNVCDYCGAVYNDTCGGCAAPHVILYRRLGSYSIKAIKKATRYEAEAHLKRCASLLIVQASEVDIVPLSLWVEAIENLLDWRP